MVETYGVEKCGFLTLTFAENVTDRREAQRRFHSLLSNFLGRNLLAYVAAVERQARGAIHFHLLVAVGQDIRTGFDVEFARALSARARAGLVVSRAEQRQLWASANPALRGWWGNLRSELPRYGFGRSELLPVLGTEEGVARYVGGYVSCEAQRREERDKGMRTLRYSLPGRPWSVAWRHAGGAAQAYRVGVACMMAAQPAWMVSPSGAFGKGWEYHLGGQLTALGAAYIDKYGVQVGSRYQEQMEQFWLQWRGVNEC